MNLEKGGKRMIDLEKRAKAWDEFSGEAREFTIGDTFNSAYELGVRDGAASVPRWTRVEDGLPEKPGDFITTRIKNTDGTGLTVRETHFHPNNPHLIKIWMEVVKAWMPKPEPFTEEQDEQR